jgi:hypothetical protein
MNKMGANIEITSCASYIPQLAFRDDAGMEGEFNTFRLGGMWAQRLHPGQHVMLVRTNEEKIGVAVVQSVHVGSLAEMIDEHGLENHLSIAADRRGRELDMLKVMKAVYGSTRVDLRSMTTVVYLKRHGRNDHEGKAEDRPLSGDIDG